MMATPHPAIGACKTIDLVRAHLPSARSLERIARARRPSDKADNQNA